MGTSSTAAFQSGGLRSSPQERKIGRKVEEKVASWSSSVLQATVGLLGYCGKGSKGVANEDVNGI